LCPFLFDHLSSVNVEEHDDDEIDNNEKNTNFKSDEAIGDSISKLIQNKIKNKDSSNLSDLEKQITETINNAEKSKSKKFEDPYYINIDSSKLFLSINTSKSKKKELKIPDSELYKLSPDSIIKKYKIEGFWKKLYAKQSIKLRQNGGSLFHYCMTKLIWVTLAVIPILAFVFLLLYRREKHYYVEHVVFLLHYNTTLFTGLIVTLWIFDYWDGITGIFMLWAMIHFFLALKNYYQQSKRMTFFKYSIITFSYTLLAILGFTFSLILGFLLF
jgi:hypothetical protein